MATAFTSTGTVVSTVTRAPIYRRQLERAIAFFDGKDPVPPARAVLRARLDAVLAEQDERARLAHA